MFRFIAGSGQCLVAYVAVSPAAFPLQEIMISGNSCIDAESLHVQSDSQRWDEKEQTIGVHPRRSMTTCA